MDVAQRPPAPQALAASLPQRRAEVHQQCIRSLAQSNPAAIAALISRWLRHDATR
jgi:flagellar biosynthesis/type III secretory pathway M-ring protein FliF/YscJ